MSNRPKIKKKRDLATTKISRHSFDFHWLAQAFPVKENRKFQQHPWSELSQNRSKIRSYLSQAIVDHHINQGRISNKLKKLGYNKTADFIASELPKDNRTRKGNFGEIVASEHLMQRYGYRIPVFKIRFRESHNLPMRGEDIIAFKVGAQNKIERVIIGEAKAIVKFARHNVNEAHTRLLAAYNPKPMTLSMIAEILFDRGDDNLGEEIERILEKLMYNDFPNENWIFIINESQPADLFSFLDQEKITVPNLNCFNLELKGLSVFVEDLFNNPSFQP